MALNLSKISSAFLIMINGLRWRKNDFQHNASNLFFSDINQKPFTMFSHDEELGIKCMWNRGCFLKQSLSLWCLCMEQLPIQVNIQLFRCGFIKKIPEEWILLVAGGSLVSQPDRNSPVSKFKVGSRSKYMGYTIQSWEKSEN